MTEPRPEDSAALADVGRPALRLAWLTDIHLNFLQPAERYRFWESLIDQADVFAITGDIGESRSVAGFLREMEGVLRKPIYFVLGNHDFYRGSIADVRRHIAELTERSEYLTYLSAAGVVELTPHTALVGHDGWADGRLGDFHGSPIFLNDYVAIKDLRKGQGTFGLDKHALGETLRQLGDEAACHFRETLPQAVAAHPFVIGLTHVPPYKEATWHEGRLSDDDWLPHFSCQATGDAMRQVMHAHPEAELLVLCGHTHGLGEAQIADNLRVLTGGAEYGRPVVQRIFDVFDSGAPVARGACQTRNFRPR
jgi:predicted MPP superfamily phosphohydrolase